MSSLPFDCLIACVGIDLDSGIFPGKGGDGHPGHKNNQKALSNRHDGLAFLPVERAWNKAGSITV